MSKNWPILMTSEEDFPEINPEDIIIDGIFGIGLNRPPKGWVKKLIIYLNSLKTFKLSIDLSSGLYPNKAIEDDEAVIRADHVLTFQAPKLAFFLPDTATYVLNFEVLDIGLDAEFLSSIDPIAQTFGKSEALNNYISRKKFDHKGKFGHALIVGGSFGKIGAVILASEASLRIGAGLVSAFTPGCGYQIIQTAAPEVMVVSDKAEKNISAINIDFIPSAVGIGIGMGTHNETAKALMEFLPMYNAPMVIDADALNCLSEHPKLQKTLPKNSILTPHPGELERLIGPWQNDYEKIEKAKKFSKKHKIILVIKGAHTLIIYDDMVYINTSGNPGMATAGSGDVLTGIITGLLSQGYPPLQAALFGVYTHGIAGDIASNALGFEAVIASDISNNIGNAYLSLLNEEENQGQNEEKQQH